MRFTATVIAAMAFSLITAAPIDDGPDNECTPFQDEQNRFPAVRFSSWITECGDTSGHTMGMNLVYRKYAGICLPLPDDIRGLDIEEINTGCRSTFSLYLFMCVCVCVCVCVCEVG